ncbi:MAG: hypothetical protein COA47_09265 [Robiginitomaculum sp.]|nr:MAG: hypothetical protein COA47_09265 [Robiginitomaculum sp.]
MGRFKLFILAFALIVIPSLIATPASAHPADEFCAETSEMDPALCRALAEADSAETAKPEITRPAGQTVRLYVKLGFVHILPRGTDHILFVLALFLASTRLRPLLIQISVFTLAHTLTLALAASGKVSAPPDIVEPMIAASIAFVAIENLIFKDMTKWRPILVFGFGLFHGLGFAGVLADMGLAQEQFLVSLISFNVGVELGQLSVILAAWATLHWFYKKSWYRARITQPISLFIAITGLVWAVQRGFF